MLLMKITDAIKEPKIPKQKPMLRSIHLFFYERRSCTLKIALTTSACDLTIGSNSERLTSSSLMTACFSDSCSFWT